MPEPPSDANGGPPPLAGDTAADVATFLADLRELRVQAGAPTYAWLARRTGFPRSTVFDGLRRTGLPNRDLTLALVHALGGDRAGWNARWTALRSRVEMAAESSRAEHAAAGDQKQ